MRILLPMYSFQTPSIRHWYHARTLYCYSETRQSRINSQQRLPSMALLGARLSRSAFCLILGLSKLSYRLLSHLRSLLSLQPLESTLRRTKSTHPGKMTMKSLNNQLLLSLSPMSTYFWSTEVGLCKIQSNLLDRLCSCFYKALLSGQLSRS
jgi:hypothetical protein